MTSFNTPTGAAGLYRPASAGNDVFDQASTSCESRETLVTEIVNRVSETLGDQVKHYFNSQRLLQEHVADIRKEREEATGLDLFDVEQFIEFISSEVFLKSIESKLTCKAPSLKRIRS